MKGALFVFLAYASVHVQEIVGFAPLQYRTSVANCVDIRSIVSIIEFNDVDDYVSLGKVSLRRTLPLYGRMDDDEDDDDDYYDSESKDPLANGVDAVAWLPSAVGSQRQKGDEKLTQKDSEILPLFPLGGIVYTPNSEHILNIFEPRYREMYSDILMNGSKKFAVSMAHPTEPGRFAQMAVLFELQDLKEVSEQTGDRIKYICSHKVTGRVKLHRIINPEAWEARNTYLRVEGTVIDDSGKSTIPSSSTKTDESSDIIKFAYNSFAGDSNPEEEKLLRNAFYTLVELQHELEEDVRFTRASVTALAVKPGSGSDGLWQTIKLWQSFVDQRLMSRQNELQRDFQVKLQDFLKKEKGLKSDELPSAIGLQDLSPSLQQEVIELQKRMAVELKPLILESTLTMQKILEAKDHTERLQLLRHFVTSETKRLKTKKAITGMFSGSAKLADNIAAAIPPEEKISDASSNIQSSFFADEDAFQ